MHHQTLLSYLKRVLETPTAPFHEYRMAHTIRELLARFPHVSVSEDRFGNLVACYRRGRKKARLAFGAHLDHPGWVRTPGDAKGNPEFLGWVPEERLDRGEVEWFGDFGMWKLPPFQLKEGLIHSRACDDLIGCVEILSLFHELERQEAEATVYGLFTRAEEVGFVGAVHLAKQWPLPEGVCFVSLETSAPRGGAEMGKGPVVRAGDRMSLFDDAVTAELLDAAAAAKIPVQRALLDGGSCEATATQLYGIPSAGMSIILGNYHNCDPDGGIDSEYVSLSDVKATIKLITTTTLRLASGGARTSAKAAMKRRLEDRLKTNRRYDRAARPAWRKHQTG